MTGIDLNSVFRPLGQPIAAPGDPAVQKDQALQGASDTLSASAGADRSAVSTVAGALSQAVSTSDVRSEKVEQLKAAIASGSYNVSSSDVADKLIRNMMEGK